MKETQPDTNSGEKLDAIRQEIRLIRILLYVLVLLVATFMSRSIARDLPPLVILVGLLIPILWTVIDAIVRRSRRKRHEAEVFPHLSGRVQRPTR